MMNRCYNLELFNYNHSVLAREPLQNTMRICLYFIAHR